jgi:hypothetical protein
LMKEYGQDVWNFAYLICKKRDMADNITQDVFLQAYRHVTSEIDLDGDGIQELVSPEENAVPPMVTIHHWNMESKVFESAQVDPDASKMYNIDREKHLTYSYLFQEEGNWFIEFGVGDELHQFLQYQNGVLKEVNLADNRSRLMESRKQQNLIH